ncbi:MAG TPA: beta-ketoacyl-ACP synthase III [Blastocatellia bacterium]|nr:beta-ketoacyl-ACP synthase III [Blastocatellia bacterium]
MANRRRAKITALGRHVPPRVVTNYDLSEMVETNNEWIVERTGIHERHWVEKGTPTSELAVKAADDLLKRRGIEAHEIELIIVATVTPDMFFPSTACLVQNKIRATRAWGFDISAACSSFLYALTTGAQFIESGHHKKVLVVGADVMTSILNPEDRTTLILFGDGAGAVLLEPCADGEENYGILDYSHEIDGSGGEHLYMPGGGSLHPSSHETVEKKMHYIHQNGQAVFKYAVRKMEEMSRSMLERNNLTGADIGAFIAHQANLRIIDATANKIGLDQNKVIKNIHKYGNTTAATIPLAIGDAIEAGKLKKGDLALFAAVGAGFTAGSVLARWAY